MARSEADIIAAESGGNPYIGWGDVDLSKKPLDKYGFPIWEGRMGPAGISHAAGIYQFEPATWREGAEALGVTDFSPESQKKVFDWTYAKYGDAPWKASAGGKTQPEGVYGGQTHVTLTHPGGEEDGLITALLDGLMTRVTGKGQQDTQAEQPDLLSQIVSQQAQISPVERAQPQHPPEQYIEPPAPVPPAADIVSTQKPLEGAGAQGSVGGDRTAPATVPPIPAPSPAPAVASPAVSPPPPAPTTLQVNPGRQLLDSIFRGMQLSPMTGPLTTVGRGMTAPPEVVRQPLPIDRQARVNPGRKLLDEMLTAGGIVPPPTTDVQQAAAEQRQAQAPSEPLIGVGEGGALTGRIPRMAEATVPFLAGGAPGGAVSTGIRLPGRGGAVPPRIEPTFGPRPSAPGMPTGRVEPTFGEGAAPTQAEGSPAVAEGRAPPSGEPPRPPPEPPPPNGAGPDVQPPAMPDGKRLAVERQKTQDLLNWTSRNKQADAIEGQQFFDGLPEQYKDPNFRAHVADEIEKKLIDPSYTTPELEDFLRTVKPWTDMEKSFGERLRRMGMTEEQLAALGNDDLRGVEEGHVHRMVQGQTLPGEIMPNTDPIGVRSGGRSLAKTASGMQQRTDWFVGDDGAGTRTWSQKRLGETQKPPPGYTRYYSTDGKTWTTKRTPALTKYIDYPTTSRGISPRPEEFRQAKYAPPEKYGDKFVVGNREVEARRPTMTEVEANTPVRYHRDYVLGLINNVNRLRSAYRNLQAIDQLKTRLQGQGFWVPQEGRNLHTPPDPSWLPVDLPQMRGWAVPRIANTINDFARGTGDLDPISRFLVGSLFLLPVGHIRNVGMHYTIGRGLDWGFRNPQLLRSFNHVWHMDEVYQRFLRENGPGMYPGAANVHGKLVERLMQDMAADPGYETVAKRLGTTMKELLPAIYRWSSRSLWFSNDHMFLARTLEYLNRFGHPDPLKAPSAAWTKAFEEVKREIPPYEIPDQILGSRAVQKLLMSPAFAFGRYTYDKYRILGDTVVDMVGRGPRGKGLPQVEAAAKALLTLMLAFPVHSALNAALQWATGSDNAKVYGAGPTTLIRTAGAGLGKLAGVDLQGRMGWMLGMTPGEIDFSHALSGILSINPGFAAIARVFGGGHDSYTGQPMIGPHASGRGMTAQAAEALLGSTYPGEIALQALREGPGALTTPLGFNMAGPRPPSGRGQLMQRRMERARERRDPFQNLLNSVLP